MAEAKVPKEPAILFVGFKFKEDGVDLARAAGCKAVLLTQKAKSKAERIFDDVILADLKNADAVEALIPQVQSKYEVRGVLTNYEHYVVLRSYIAERFGVPTSSVYAASCTRNKALQRHALGSLPENIPSRLVSNFQEAKEAFDALGQDVFVKCISGVKSKLIFHVRTETELQYAVKAMLEGSKTPDEDLYEAYEFMHFDFEYPNPKTHFLIEKTVTGRLVSVGSVVGSQGVWHFPSIVDITTARELGKADSYLAYRILPSQSEPAFVQRCQEVVEAAIQILGLRNCAIHAELMVTEAGDIHLIEIASRLGGYRQDMYQAAYGLSLTEPLIRAVLGGETQTQSEPKRFVAVLEFFPEKEGHFVGIEGFDEKALPPDVELLFFKSSSVGRLLGPAKLGYPVAMKMMLAGASYAILNDLCQSLAREVKVTTASS